MFGKVKVVSVRIEFLRGVTFFADSTYDPSRGLEKRRDGLWAVDKPVDQKRRGRCCQRARAFLLRSTCGNFN